MLLKYAALFSHLKQALDAFLHLSRTGQAKDYDGKMRTYEFASRATVGK